MDSFIFWSRVSDRFFLLDDAFFAVDIDPFGSSGLRLFFFLCSNDGVSQRYTAGCGDHNTDFDVCNTGVLSTFNDSCEVSMDFFVESADDHCGGNQKILFV